MNADRERELLAANNAYLERARTAERRLKQVEEERDRAARRCDMYHGQCDRQAAALTRFHMASTSHSATKIGLDEVRRWGLDDDVIAVVSTLIGDRLPQDITERVPLTDLALFGYGPSCPCGERGMMPGEVSDDDMCADCRAAEPAPHPVNDAELIDGLGPAYGGGHV